MKFTAEIRDVIHGRFLNAFSTMGDGKEEIRKQIQELDPEEQLVLEYYYSAMPASDIGNYPFSLFHSYADFGLKLREKPLFNTEIPEDIFLNHVVAYRINNEEIEDCRPILYNELKDRVKNKTMAEAALEVNRWCAERATYQATDERTISPLNLLKSAYGRCGEESTLAVSAMRSVGIPARQVYTPRWAHCDDNHAWVEVWCDGEWYFLGACEPEPRLNLGWFNDASARVMLVDTKASLPIQGEEALPSFGQNFILNETARYAPVRKFTVRAKGLPDSEKSQVFVRFELLNGAELYPIVTGKTDADGELSVSLGLGTILVHGVKDGRYTEVLIDTKLKDQCILDFSKAIIMEAEGVTDFDFRAPEDTSRNSVLLSEEEKSEKRRLIQEAEALRQKQVATFFKTDEANTLMERFGGEPWILEVLRQAEGNFSEIADFLRMDVPEEDKKYQIQLLKSLKKKDYRDVKSVVLKEHLSDALAYKNAFNEEIFSSYVLCPRIHFEELTAYRKELRAYIKEKGLTPEKVALEKVTPQKIMELVGKLQITPERDTERIYSTPLGAIKSGLANEMSKKILFVAICRSCGTPARVNPVDFDAEYFEIDHFQKIKVSSKSEVSDKAGESDENSTVRNKELARKKEVGCLTLKSNGEKWTYFQNWTLGILKNGSFETLELTEKSWNKELMSLELSPGFYRLITSSRTPNGNQFGRKTCFTIIEGAEKHISMSLRETEVEDLLEEIAYLPFSLHNGEGKTVSTEKLPADKDAWFIWLEEGTEPTEHVMNELLDAKEEIKNLDIYLRLIVRGKEAHENGTFQKVLKELPKVEVWYGDFNETAMPMARRMFVNPEKLPLTLLSRNGKGLYACSGYNVGVIKLLMKLMETSLKGKAKEGKK